jgi:hypothetical protein
MSGFYRYLTVFIVLTLLHPFHSLAQSEAYVQGYVHNAGGKALPSVSVSIEKINSGTISNDSGFYRIKIPSNKQITINYSCIGYQAMRKNIRLHPGETLRQNIELSQNIQGIGEVSVISEQERASSLSRINMKDFGLIPNPSGNFEALIKTQPGVSSSNELSSQYSVRGGNFDENLVYVNEIEIARPFLIRSGQQEGLSFINPDMVSSVRFSAGGFEARYGDKMSSVLDVSYRKPKEYQYIANASLLGGGATVEGISKNSKLSYIGGVRYKTSQYLLSSLDTKGEYQPAFVDIQSLIAYQPTKKLEISFLGNFAQNKYEFIPQTRSTNFGTIQQVYNLTIYYEGKEIDRYNSALGALTINFRPIDNLSLRIISSASSSYEQETFDIAGYYEINELDNTSGSSTYGDSLLNIGVGSMLNHARNYLWVNSWNLSHIGTYITRDHTLRWSLEWKHDKIKDKLNEWTYIDSAGYSIPYSSSSIQLNDFAYARNNLSYQRISGYLQDTYQFGSDKYTFYLNGGLRLNFWDYSKQWLISPRFRLSIKPESKRDIMIYLASGVYYQPPFYKEMRDFEGNLNPDIKAQQSIHFVIGSDYNLKLWDRPFKLTSEIYYKLLRHLIPYKIDNVRIRYTAQNNAKGYSKGIDLKLNGEFVQGIESWASLSLLKTEENQTNDYYLDKDGKRIEPGYYPRPTDQRVTFSLFFQDYLPNNPTFQMHMNLVYGSPLQISPPRSNRFDQTFPMGPYRRVDIGFSKIIKDQQKNITTKLRPLKELVISLEVFNLLNIYNKASYLWIQTISNQEGIPNEFAVPNYLTTRRLNIKVAMKF